MIDNTYKDWLIELKQKVRTAQLKAAVAVNTELIMLYWELGKMITEKQTAWGSKFLTQLSQDLRNEFPDMQGFSERNLKYCRQFYQFYFPSIGQQLVARLEQTNQSNDPPQIVNSENFNSVFRQQPVAQIPWGHNILIFSKSKSADEAEFYAGQTLHNGWSRNILSQQINANLFQRQGKAIHNFQNTLPEITSDLAHQMIKDPYQFDFLTLTQNYKERELENALVNNITNFLLELGSGVSEYQLSKLFPEEFKSSLPTIEEIEKELSHEL